MKDIILKALSIIVVAAAVVYACIQNLYPSLQKDNSFSLRPQFDNAGYWNTPSFTIKENADNTYSVYGKNSVYGAYLAGRVAHLRQDFDNAAEYYKIVAEKDKDNTAVNRSAYVILASLGKIDEAYDYALKEINDGKSDTLAPLVVAIKQFADGDYEKSRQTINTLQDKIHQILINPLFTAWTYAGEKNETKAMEELDKIHLEPSIAGLKLMHQAMIYDFLGNTAKAEEKYVTLVRNYPQDVTYRYLEIITDFYVRSGNKEMAHRISNKYNDNSTLVLLLKNIDSKIDSSDPNKPAVIDTPQKGLAEALFNVGTMFRLSNGGTEFAQIYIAASSYLNPQYDISKIALANVLEELGLIKEANKYYEQIPEESGSYFIAQIKRIENLNNLQEYDKAEQSLRHLLTIYPNNTQLLNDLGDIMANQNKHDEAIKIYLKAIENIKDVKSDSWPIFYALAVSYHRSNQKDLAERYMLKALELSNRNANVLNYLGYMWLDEGRNVDQAIQMIVEAYKQYPYEGHIIDSLGWAYYRIGNYEKAIEYLEQAADMNSGNAVINDHLGDAYWFIGRKNEAVFQWKHALVLKEDADSLDKKAVEAKIDEGILQNDILKVTDTALLEQLNSLSVETNK
ncbi:MAG: tetratricopeptide repeat protein [Alphaproteobacteria bacterium]